MKQLRTFNLGKLRFLASVLVALGLVLPLSTCTKGEPPVTEYHYAIGDVVNNPSCEGLCRAGAVGVSLATFLWPLAACLAAIRFTGRVGTVLRLCLEPLLLAGAGWWLYWQLLLRDPAIGAVVAALGFTLYAAVWGLECIRLVHARKANRSFG